ncbi:MAG TPA: OB-fold domain-containing protein [Egibacteraceae bacterium]
MDQQPRRSLSAALVAARLALPAWRVRVGKSDRAVAGPDEDVVTLAAAAAQPLLEAVAVRPAAIVTATVSAPLVEGGITPVLAEVLDLRDGVVVQEHGGTVAAGGSALVAAAALVAAGVAPVLYLAGDTRRDDDGRPLGDGAVAALVDAPGTRGALAEVTVQDAAAGLFRDTWRVDGEPRLRTADPSLQRWAPGRDRGDAVVAGPTAPLLDGVGALGCAGLLAGILDALASAADGDELTATVSASGLSASFAVRCLPGGAGAARRALAARDEGRRGPLPPGDADYDPYASDARAWRERALDLRLEALRDPASGEVLFPPPPRSELTAGLEPVRLARRGRVYTHTRDHVFPYGAPLSTAVVELDGGGRFYGQVADGLDVEIGQEVELVLRRLHRGGGVPQYFWKIAPRARAGVREEGAGHADRR